MIGEAVMQKPTTKADKHLTFRRRCACGRKRRLHNTPGLFNSEKGFSLPEMAMTIIVLGILVGLAWWDLSSSNNRNGLNSASEQVKRAMSEAFSIAQNEKVKVTLTFYSSSNENTSVRNTYSLSRGDPGVSMKPPRGIAYFQQGADYYCKILEGSSGTTIDSGRTIIFMPRGASTQCEDAGGNPISVSVTLSRSGAGSKTITVNSKGAIK